MTNPRRNKSSKEKHSESAAVLTGGFAAGTASHFVSRRLGRRPIVGLGVAAVGAVGMATTRGKWRAGAAGVMGAGIGIAALSWLERRRNQASTTAAAQVNDDDVAYDHLGNAYGVPQAAPNSRNGIIARLGELLLGKQREPEPEVYTGGAVAFDGAEDFQTAGDAPLVPASGGQGSAPQDDGPVAGT